MNRELTLRQITFMYLFISISTVLRQIPQALALEAGRSGYLSPIISIVATLPLTAIVIYLMKAFPGFNFYEILVQLTGTFLSKVIIFAYLIWLFLVTTAKATAYSLTLEFTLMPRTRSDFFMTVMIIMVFYALLRGIKTIFRFSELTLGITFILFAILFLCAVSRLRTDYLIPVSTVHLFKTTLAAKHVAAVGGNIIIALFFADKLGISITKSQFHKLWFGVIIFTCLAFVLTLLTFGISGASLTANLPFPFYITVKSISIFNIFERFEVLITLICILSDYIAIAVFVVLLLRCFEWLFGLTKCEVLYLPIGIIIFYLTYYLSSTQFEYNFLYRVLLVNFNLIFQFIIPFVMAFLCLIMQKRLSKQFKKQY